MSFDNSRFTFNPWNDYLGVVMQQGRVQLDSDWNEWLAEFGRRIQAGTLDSIGLVGVPSNTPAGFKIKAYQDASGKNHITIGAGRIYVDGFLAENRGLVVGAQWDSALAEWSGAPAGGVENDLEYTNQPYLPGATIPGNGPFLVYLDLWQREVTYLEDLNLVDQAVGVDTTGRLQIVWQVKLLDVSSVAGGVVCSTPDSVIASTTNWGNLIQPSPNPLTIGVVPSATAGPCSLSPATGYSGLENQLYRVQIHQSGSNTSTPQATFKWSREDASVATAVTAISTVTNSVGATAGQLTVQSMGRDQVLGFNPGDWIEIIDDYLELNPPEVNGQPQPGELHQIDSINSTAKTITLDSQVSANFPVISNQVIPSRHTRIRRWDQAGTIYESDGQTAWANADATGDILVPPPGIALILENGITVAFGGSAFQTGDFWTFSARIADGSVTILTQPNAAQAQSGITWNPVATYTQGQIVTSSGNYYICTATNTNQQPPNAAFWALQTAPTQTSIVGIHHHYCRLGMVNFNANPPAFADCRQIFLPLANPCIHVTSILLGGPGSDQSLLNDGTITVQSLAKGITVVCDVPVSPEIITQPAKQLNCPICFVTADLPAPTTPPGGAIGFSALVLSATVSVASNTISWTPTTDAITALTNQVSPTGLPVLARLTLKGNFIWARDNQDIYLNGAVVGVPTTSGTQQTTSLQLPSGDGRRAADVEMWFWLISQPLAILSASSLNFSTPQLVGSPTSQSVTLTSQSATALNFTGPIAFSGANPGDFTQTNNCGTTLAANASCTITVTFTPAAPGPRTAQATINLMESGSTTPLTPLTITLAGTGTQPLLGSSPTSLTFPAQTVGTTSAPLTVTLTNPGISEVTNIAISIEGNDYTISNTCTGSLSPNQQCTINVQFVPTAAGSRSTALLITSTAVNGTLSIPITGIGVAPVPVITASATSLTFGQQKVGTPSAPQTVTLTSTGNTQYAIGFKLILGANSSSFSKSDTCGATLQPGQQCTITVVFTPTAIGAMTAQLEITNTDPNIGALTILLSGTGTKLKDGKDSKEGKEGKEGGLEKVRFDKNLPTEQVLPRLRPSSSPEAPAEAGGEGATRRAFINPEERPQVGPQPSDQP
jgi:hypothetical protein